MRYDIQMITCYLPDPWYRVPVMWGITIGMFGGFGLMFLGALCTTTFGPVIPFIVSGFMSCVVSLFVMWKYDDWTDDPCPIILDKKMYRETEAAGRAFSSHSKVNDHILDVGAAREEARMLEEQAERERKEAELHE